MCVCRRSCSSRRCAGFAFRGWLIAQGQDAYEAAIADPDSLADLPELRGADGGLPVAECMWFVAIDVYQERTDGELPPEGALGSELIGSWWPHEQHDEQRRRRYPRLWARFHGETHPEPGGSDNRGKQRPRPPCRA